MTGRSRQTATIALWAVLACGSIASAVTLSGRVYEGPTGVEPPTAKAIQGATVNLYGANNADQMGTYITHTTTGHPRIARGTQRYGILTVMDQ